LINISTSKFPLSPIKHSNLSTLHTSIIFCKSNLVRLLVPQLLSHSRALWSPLDSKLQTNHSPTRHLFFGTLFLKNSVNLSFISLNLTYCIPQRLPFLLYLHLNFTLSSKLISSKNHFPLGSVSLSDVFLWLCDLANVFHLTFLSFASATIISFHLHYGLRFYTVSGNKHPSISIWLVGFCRNVKSPHSFQIEISTYYNQASF